ncbi:MAG: hypothetical protein ACO1OG_12165 [Devosia sp.]
MLPNPLFIDCEASGLRESSFPIEVGWCTLAGNSESVLIAPHSSWQSWDESAELLHGVTRAELALHGVRIDEACDRIAEAVDGHIVLSDGVSMDRFWLDRLFEAAGRRMPFKVHDFLDYAGSTLGRVALEMLPGFEAERPHRAEADARFLRDLWVSVTGS